MYTTVQRVSLPPDLAPSSDTKRLANLKLTSIVSPNDTPSQTPRQNKQVNINSVTTAAKH